MQVRLTRDGWLIDMRPDIQGDIAFEDKISADDFMDMMESVSSPLEALKEIIRRIERASAAKHRGRAAAGPVALARGREALLTRQTSAERKG